MRISKYVISEKLSDDKVLLLSTISGSVIALDIIKFNSLKNNKFSCFTDNEIDALKSMSFVCEKDEFEQIISNRQNLVENSSTKPLKLTILTTSYCNANCYYCFEKENTKCNKSHMSRETADIIIDYIKSNYNNSPVRIGWFGGEPLLKKDIIGYISDALLKCNIEFESSMISNGILLDSCTPDEIKKWNLTKIQITVDAIGEEYNSIKKVRNENNAFHHLMQNIHYLLSLNVFTQLRVNFDSLEVQKALDTIDYIHEEFGNHPKLYVYANHLFGETFTSPLDMPESENPYIALTERLIKYNYVRNTRDIGIKPKNVFCGIYGNYFVIDPEGNFFKCEHMIGNPNNIVGDVKNGITNESEYEYWTSVKLPYDECQNCVLLPCCQGGCKANFKELDQKFVCLPIKNCIKKLMIMYYRKEVQ